MVGVTQSQTSPYTAVLTLGSTADSRAVARLRPFRPIRGALKFVGARSISRRARAARSPRTPHHRGRRSRDRAGSDGHRSDDVRRPGGRRRPVAHAAADTQPHVRVGLRRRPADNALAGSARLLRRADRYANGVGTFDVTVRVSPGDVEVRRTLTDLLRVRLEQAHRGDRASHRRRPVRSQEVHAAHRQLRRAQRRGRSARARQDVGHADHR